MARTPRQTAPESPPALLVPRDEAATLIAARVALGKQLLARAITTTTELEEVRHEHTKWSKYNHDLLLTLFSTPAIAEEYSRFYGFVVGMSPRSLQEKVSDLHKDITDGIHRLDSIGDRLELMRPADGVGHHRSPGPATPIDGTVFVVHGHDESARETVARFLATLDLSPIILHEQASAGRTIIEKIEHYAGVSFAVVLLTPDDVGAPASAPERLQSRARQNVILELGYFIGRLGRNRVCALYRGQLELPSDFGGVVYVPLDDGGGWRLQLAKELIEAGFAVDMNRAL